MTHPELGNPHFARPDRRSPGNCTYRTYRLTLSEFSADRALVSLIVTDVGGRTLSETRLHVAQIDRLDEDGLPVNHVVLFQRAVNLL